MLKKIMLSMVCVCALTAAPSKASDAVFGPFQPMLYWMSEAPEAFYGPFQPAKPDFEQQALLYKSEQGMSLKFAGEQEQGALSFFVAPDSALIKQNELYANDLNALSPAAGIQFKMDFNL